jgi:endonuclease III
LTVAAPSATEKRRALTVLQRLKREFPDAKCALDHETPHQLLVATILSAQCTDKRVNLVTPGLFAKYPDVAAFAHAEQGEMEEAVKTTGFFRNKARAIIGMSRAVLEEHGGEVPRTMDELTALPGVGRKTANVLLGNAFDIPGLVVDTHVTRLSNLLGFTKQKDAVKIEHELMELFPRKWWTLSSHLLILHGRATCIARRPRCAECRLRDLCPGATV